MSAVVVLVLVVVVVYRLLYFSALHHIVLQRVYLRGVLIAETLVVLLLRGERVLDVERFVLLGRGGLHGVLQLVLGMRIILENQQSLLEPPQTRHACSPLACSLEPSPPLL